MSSLSPDLFSLIQMITMVLSMIIGCVVLAGVLLLFAADRRSYTLCMVIGVTMGVDDSWGNTATLQIDCACCHTAQRNYIRVGTSREYPPVPDGNRLVDRIDPI